MENACSNLITSDPADVILLVFAMIVLVVLVWCIWAFFYAVFLFIFSRWDDSKVKSAWNGIRYMIIGLFMTVMLLFMWPTVLRVFKMQNSDSYSAKYIFVKVGQIVSCVWTWIVSVIKDYPNNNPFGDTRDIFPSQSLRNDDVTIYTL
jgi:hypothetical protein